MVLVLGISTKFNLLIRYGPFEDLDELASHFGRSPSTLKYWGHGNADRAPNQLPNDQLENWIKVLRLALGDISDATVAELTNGPPNLLEQHFWARRSNGLAQLIDTYADVGEVTLIRDDGSISLVQIGGHNLPAPNWTVKLGELFRLIFRGMRTHPFEVALQRAPSAWGMLPMLRNEDAECLVPGTDGRTPSFMSETSETGLHQFIWIGMDNAPDIDLFQYAAEGTPLDIVALNALSECLKKAPSSKRHIIRATIQIVRD